MADELPQEQQALLWLRIDVLEQEYHLRLAEEVTIRVLEEAPSTFTLVLPAVEETLLELTDADLEGIVGGNSYGASAPATASKVV